ncbi:MAG: zinc ribbon domain-containing protein [Clostridia bacterium]|nr:zinc ribbon domain-containing protein [Clostridia bacterium]
MQDNHESTKKKLKIIGGILLVVGAVFAITGFISFFSAFNNGGWPELFWMAFLGLPMCGIGGSIIGIAYKREISKYMKDESVPVINEAAEELSPAVKAVTRAVKDGVGGSRGGSNITCKCGEVNPPDGKFCTRCGAPLLSACPHCGGTVDADDKFCGNCGNKIR